MEHPRFDNLTRALSQLLDRRGILRGSLGFLGLAATGVAVNSDDAIGKKKRKKRCGKGKKRCGKKCVKGKCCPGKSCGSDDCLCTRSVEGKAFCAFAGVTLCFDCLTSDTCDTGSRCARLVPDGPLCCNVECKVIEV
jgi:hypothetical protein